MGASQVISNRAPRIRFESANRVGPEKGRYNLVVSKPRFRRFWKSLGLGGSRVEYR